MKLILLIIISLCSSIGMTTIATPEQIPEQWKNCSSDKDCVAAKVGCGHWIPINKKHLGSGNYIQDANKTCSRSGGFGPQPKVSCMQGVCEATK